MRIRANRASVALCFVLMSALSISCNKGTKIVPVSGQVLIDGQPLTHGFVQVQPAGYRAASAKIGPDGRFTLTTHDNNDGCAVGTHPVAIIGLETLGPSSQKWHAPKEYSVAETSGLTVNITGPTNDLKIELTWNGGKPFIERSSPE